ESSRLLPEERVHSASLASGAAPSSMARAAPHGCQDSAALAARLDFDAFAQVVACGMRCFLRVVLFPRDVLHQDLGVVQRDRLARAVAAAAHGVVADQRVLELDLEVGLELVPGRAAEVE